MKTVELTSPITTHKGQVTTVTLREPKARDYFALGEPLSFVKTDNGTVPVEAMNVVSGYVERCMVEPGAEFLDQVSLADTMRLKDAVLGFFTDAMTAAYPAPATSSSSTSESSPQPSAAT